MLNEVCLEKKISCASLEEEGSTQQAWDWSS